MRTLTDTGRRTRSETLWCIRLDDPQVTPPRVAFSIGRSVGPAVIRNRLRRRLRAILRTMAASGTLRDGWVLIGVRARRGTQPSAVERTFAQLAGEVTALLEPAVPA